MKILVVSDSHLFDDDLNIVTQKYKSEVDLMIHCGDSSLLVDDPIISQYDLVVQGNHDEAIFPKYLIYKDLCVTHGQFYHVYKGYDDLIQLCKEHNCHICFHGHTHVPTHQVHEHIHFINPGSLMMNRGSYGYGTYAIVDYCNDRLDVKFYNHKTHQICDQYILTEGLELLEEFKKIA